MNEIDTKVKESTEAKIAVMQAYARGAVIESRERTLAPAEWRFNTQPGWNWHSYEYRVKPEPRTLYVVEATNKSDGKRENFNSYDKVEDAKYLLRQWDFQCNWRDPRIVEYVEQLP